MNFDDWWEINRPKTFALGQLSTAKAAWLSATAAERQRCREIAEEHERHASVIGRDVANSIAEDIGE